MATAPFNHGVRVLRLGEDARPIAVSDVSTVGAVITAPDADASVFPPDEPVQIYTHETEKIASLGATGTALDVINAVKAQGIEASIVMVRVEEGADTAATQAAMVGSAASQTGVHALEYALGHVGLEPDLLIAPGYAAGRVDNAKNPVADALEQTAKKLQAVAILDTGGPDKETSLAYRADFSDRFAYLVDPMVRMLPTGATEIAVKPASPYAAGLFVKRDKEKGGPYWSPSNQECGGILGIARPVSYFDGEIDHEANYLNENGIATFIPAQVVQGAGGTYSANGRILWGNRTTSDDPLWVFVNVVRTRATIEKTIMRSFRWANDQNLSPQLVISIMRSLQQFLDELKAVGAILGGDVYWDRDVNTNASLRLGQLRIEFDAEEAPPLEDLTFGSRRNEVYFDVLADEINRRINVSFDRTSGV
ncbi:phage tail sheath C-terminal domain-containing protein [Breoghania sp.]|uniref:phage tail sheath C-terminal domain-containing protein n=1 Tax=Breoghania sp. TaxID=2065378 RepID=UPI002AA8D6F6|nr:phage tail sheath C-terminal domain-containing protein [Breoghania sp.]